MSFLTSRDEIGRYVDKVRDYPQRTKKDEKGVVSIPSFLLNTFT